MEYKRNPMSQPPPTPATVALHEAALAIDRALDQLDQAEDMFAAVLRNLRAQLRTTRNRALDDAYNQPAVAPRLELVPDVEHWISYREAAVQANKSYRTIKRWAQTGRLQAYNGQTKREWVEQAIAAPTKRTRKDPR